MDQIPAFLGRKLTLILNRAKEYRHKDLETLLNRNCITLNFFLGIGMRSDIKYFRLTYNDFALTDLAMEMLYIKNILEAKRLTGAPF